ncbi:hypothetical protein Btru_052174 [Bulinus truncatus]|nr:hypothetical protein Btru_052174 [Bulinus truncatus]
MAMAAEYISKTMAMAAEYISKTMAMAAEYISKTMAMASKTSEWLFDKPGGTQLTSLTLRNFQILTIFFITCVFDPMEANHRTHNVSLPNREDIKGKQLSIKYIRSSDEEEEDENENKFCVWKNMRSYYALCYMYFFKRLTRMGAEYACQQTDGYLAHVVDPRDMPNVKFRWNFTNHYWVGVKLENHDGCVALTSAGTFEPVSCSARLPYICMFEDVRTNRESLKEGRVVMKRRSSFHYLAAIMFVAIIFSLPCLILPYTASHGGEEKNQDEGDGSVILAEGVHPKSPNGNGNREHTISQSLLRME